MRADKYLWAVRLFKTRSIAAEACEKGAVKVSGINIKPSRILKIGDSFTIRRTPVIYTYEILELTPNRLPASRVKEFINDITPPEEIAKKEMDKLGAFSVRDRGTGRPTKRDRRDMDKFYDS